MCSFIRVLKLLPVSRDVFNRELAAFKAVDDIGFLVWFQGVLWPYQGGAKGLHRFMRHQYPMFGQNARHCFRCSLYIRDLYTVCLLLHYGPLSTGLEAPSNELPVTQCLHHLDAAQGLPGTQRETQCLNVAHCSS